MVGDKIGPDVDERGTRMCLCIRSKTWKISRFEEISFHSVNFLRNIFFFFTRIFSYGEWWRKANEVDWNEGQKRLVQKWWQRKKISVMECLWKGWSSGCMKILPSLQMKFHFQVNEILLWLSNARNSTLYVWY